MHFKSKGAMVARTLSFQGCEFSAVTNVMSKDGEKVYDKSAELWAEMHLALINELGGRRKRSDFEKNLNKVHQNQSILPADMKKLQELYADSDDEGDGEEPSGAEIQTSTYRRKCRNRPAHVLSGVYWGAHQRFFRSLCMASKVDATVKEVKEALKEGHCCIIGLQSTGEARAKDAAKQAGLDQAKDGIIYLEDFISDSKEGMKWILMNLFALQPKPKGVIPPNFLKPQTANESDETKPTNPGRAAAKVAKEAPKEKTTSKKERAADFTKVNWLNSDVGDLLDSDSDSDSDDEIMVWEKDDDTDTAPISWDKIPLHKTSKCPNSIRRWNYHQACERLERWFEAVEGLELPPNPLDRLLNELGGPNDVAGTTID